MLTLDEEPILLILISILLATIFSTSVLVLFSDIGPEELRIFQIKVFDWRLEKEKVDINITERQDFLDVTDDLIYYPICISSCITLP